MLNLMGSLVFRPEATASVADITTAVGTWLTAVLGWITSVYAWVIAEPLVVFPLPFLPNTIVNLYLFLYLTDCIMEKSKKKKIIMSKILIHFI